MNIEKQIDNLVKKANFSLRGDVLKLLKKAHKAEKNAKAKKALSWIIENARVAKNDSIAICQDTGMPVVFIDVGNNVKVDSALIERIKKLIALKYESNALRASIVDPVERGKPSHDGVVTHIELSKSHNGLRLTLLPKGFGSENKSQLKMFNPTARLSQVGDFIIECVKRAGPEACPPFVVGVGIGGTSDECLLLAKRALLEKIDKPNKNARLRKLEKEVLDKINALKIGPMGLGGKTTCFAVKVKTAPTHIAGLPVGVNISCHALRSASIVLKNL